MSVYDAANPADDQLQAARDAEAALTAALMVDDPITQTRYRMDPPCTIAPEEFFHAKSLGYRGVSPAAKALCGGCQAQAECALYAAIAGERYGTWGGHAAATIRAAFKAEGTKGVLRLLRSELSRDGDAE
jgi:hypothetical protein